MGIIEPAKSDGRGYSGAEDENLGGVGKAESPGHEVAPGIHRHVPDEYREHGEAAEEIEPPITWPGRHCVGYSGHVVWLDLPGETAWGELSGRGGLGFTASTDATRQRCRQSSMSSECQRTS